MTGEHPLWKTQGYGSVHCPHPVDVDVLQVVDNQAKVRLQTLRGADQAPQDAGLLVNLTVLVCGE